MTDIALDPSLLRDDVVESPARRALRRLMKRKGAVLGMVVIALFVLMGLAPKRHELVEAEA